MNTFETHKKAHIMRMSEVGTQTPITRQTLAQIEENNSVVLAPNDQQRFACMRICERVQECINDRILKNIPGDPTFKQDQKHVRIMKVRNINRGNMWMWGS